MELDRKTIKSQAKELIRGNVFSLFLIIFVVALLCGGLSGFVSSAREVFYNVSHHVSLDQYFSNKASGDTPDFSVSFGIFVYAFLPLAVTLAGLLINFVRGTRYDIGGEFTYVFKNTFNDTFVQKFLLKLLVGLFTILWTLLFIIPGFVYHYKTYFVDFIMADNPKLTWQETIELSKKMTNGHKGELFMLDLSFILWYMFVGITCGFGLIYVAPYIAVTQALYYENFKQRGLVSGEISSFDYLSQQEKAAQAYNNGYGAPAQPQYQPPQGQYQPPVQQYQPPVQPQYQPQQYQPPVQPQYQPPVQQPVPPQANGVYAPPAVAPQAPVAEPEAPQESFYTPPADAQKYFTPEAPAEPEIAAEPETPADTAE